MIRTTGLTRQVSQAHGETFAQIEGSNQNEYTYYYAALCFKGLNDQKQCINLLNQSIFQAISQNVATYYGEIADSEEKLVRHKKAAMAYQKALQNHFLMLLQSQHHNQDNLQEI